MKYPITSETDNDTNRTTYTDADGKLVAIIGRIDTETGRNAAIRDVDFMELVSLANRNVKEAE